MFHTFLKAGVLQKLSLALDLMTKRLRKSKYSQKIKSDFLRRG